MDDLFYNNIFNFSYKKRTILFLNIIFLLFIINIYFLFFLINYSSISITYEIFFFIFLL